MFGFLYYYWAEKTILANATLTLPFIAHPAPLLLIPALFHTSPFENEAQIKPCIQEKFLSEALHILRTSMINDSSKDQGQPHNDYNVMGEGAAAAALPAAP